MWQLFEIRSEETAFGKTGIPKRCDLSMHFRRDLMLRDCLEMHISVAKRRKSCPGDRLDSFKAAIQKEFRNDNRFEKP